MLNENGLRNTKHPMPAATWQVPVGSNEDGGGKVICLKLSFLVITSKLSVMNDYI